MSENQREWKEKVLGFASQINEYVARGLRIGWDTAGPQPEEPELR